MPGIAELYVTFATDHISKHEKRKAPHKISRAKVETTLLEQLDLASFPIEYKLSWYNVILNTPAFDSLWQSTSIRHKLPKHCTARYQIDASLESYTAPSPTSSPPGDPPSLTPDRAHSPTYSSNNTTPHYPPPASPPSDNDDYISPTAAAFAATLAPGYSAPALLIDTAGFSREEGDDGAWGSPLKKPRNKACANIGGKAARGKTTPIPKKTHARVKAPRPRGKAKGKGAGKRMSAWVPTVGATPEFVPGLALASAVAIDGPERRGPISLGQLAGERKRKGGEGVGGKDVEGGDGGSGRKRVQTARALGLDGAEVGV